MSDFDKPAMGATGGATGPQKQGGKVAILAGLLCVLGGVGVFHFMKGGPQPASGAVVADPAGGLGVAAPTETAAEAQAALETDPTAKLLRSTNDLDPRLSKIPTNPFVLNERWRSTLVKEVEAAEAPVAPEPLRADPPKPVVAAPMTVDGTFKLAGIFREGGKMAAIVNGNIVFVGSVVGNAKVVDIQEGKVTLQHANAPTGPTLELSLSPKN